MSVLSSQVLEVDSLSESLREAVASDNTLEQMVFSLERKFERLREALLPESSASEVTFRSFVDENRMFALKGGDPNIQKMSDSMIERKWELGKEYDNWLEFERQDFKVWFEEVYASLKSAPIGDVIKECFDILAYIEEMIKQRSEVLTMRRRLQ